MNIFGKYNNNNPNDIYSFRQDLPEIDTAKVFTINTEKDKLRVENKNVNCLFSNLNKETFHQIYNDFHLNLNLDFEPLHLENQTYELSLEEKDKLFQIIVTSWIYYYTINNLKVKIKRNDFVHPYMVDYVLPIVDKKLGKDTKESLNLGAKILRQNLEDYTKTVKSRREYYNR